MTDPASVLFACQVGVHMLEPADPEDPAGTACQCGAVALIGVMAVVKSGRRTFLKYLVDTNPADEEQDDFTIKRLKQESVYEDDD